MLNTIEKNKTIKENKVCRGRVEGDWFVVLSKVREGLAEKETLEERLEGTRGKEQGK